jgi:hypothetical protein
MRVLVVEIVFANVDHRQLPQLRQIQLFVEQPLSMRTLSKEAHGCAAVPELS